jgi:hypothetical protein
MAQLLLFMALFATTSWARTTYTLADLEVLVTEEAHAEFFEHAMDIRPSERQDAWKAMVSKMGDSFSRKIAQKVELEKKDFQKIEQLYTWSGLKTDDVYRLRRQEIGLRYLKSCLKSVNPCWDDLKSYWEKDKADAETAFRLAEVTVGLPNSPLSTWTLLEVALKSPLSEFYCKKDFVMSALWGKIEIDYVKLGPEGDLMTKIDRTIHPDCMPILVAEAHKRLSNPPKVFDRELAFQILKSQSKADQTVTDFFYTVYLLDNPSQGELFNYSWNRVRELGGTVTRREAVLKKLRQLDPLPDAIFSTLDQTKRRVVLNHFKTYFPEYLDHYTDQCVKFYGGKGSFPSGNPTIHCQDFMNSDLAPLIIDDFKIKKYKEVRTI